MTEPTVAHAYAVVAGDAPLAAGTGIGEIPGIAGTEVQVVRCDAVAVVVSLLPEERFGTAAWQEHGQDPRWLRVIAEEHHAVIQAVADEGDVVPLRLPGIYPSVEAVRTAIEAGQSLFEGALSRVRGQVEWGAKVFAASETPATTPPTQPSSGRDYLRLRAAQASEREDARDRRRAVVLEVHETLARNATEAVANHPQDSSLSGRIEPMLLNAAYLVPRDQEETFLDIAAQTAARVQDEALLLEVTGPWPPYNFSEPAHTASEESHAG